MGDDLAFSSRVLSFIDSENSLEESEVPAEERTDFKKWEKNQRTTCGLLHILARDASQQQVPRDRTTPPGSTRGHGTFSRCPVHQRPGSRSAEIC